MPAHQLTFRNRAREAVRTEVSQVAWRLFAEHGYDATTVDTIALAAGMSRRTFFRYFHGKDDLVLARMTESGEALLAALREAPAELGAWPALRTAFQVIVDRQLANPEWSRRLQSILRDEPTVRATIEEWRRRWTTLLGPAITDRLPDGGRIEVRADAIVRSALECLETAQEAWSREPGEDLSALVDEAMGAVAPLA